MDMLLVAILVFFAMLLVLVLVHEWGHLIVAKWAGCNVEEFGFGFPPKLIGKMWRGTLYSFNLIPLGGFVRIEGENMDEENPAPTSFGSKSAGKRIAILAAGVTMNLLLAYVLLSWQAAVGTPTVVTDETASQLTDQKTYILDIVPGSPAETAGLKAFDRIVSIEGTRNPNLDTVQQITKEHLGSEVSLLVNREGVDITIPVLARENPPQDEGAMGVSLASTGLQKVPVWQAPIAGAVRTWDMLSTIISQFGNLIRRAVSERVLDEAFTGPVGIALYTGEATRMGLPYFLEFMALISMNLAIINILPIPALDGGRILFIGIEKLVGRARLKKAESIAHTTGFALLILLMVFITFKDITKFF